MEKKFIDSTILSATKNHILQITAELDEEELWFQIDVLHRRQVQDEFKGKVFRFKRLDLSKIYEFDRKINLLDAKEE